MTTRFLHNRKVFSLSLLLASCLFASSAYADKAMTRDQAQLEFEAAVKGKRVAWVPVWMGTLESEWTRIVKDQFDRYGIELIVRDPNFSNDAQLAAVSQLIDEKPDVIMVQNSSTTLLVNELKRATEAGIYVVQVNMSSNYVTDAYVGPDQTLVGNIVGEELIKTCGGGKSSGEIAIISGEATAATTIDVLKGIDEVLEKDPSIKVVSSLPADWDANKANQIATTVLQQFPNLCAIAGAWGPMTAGAAQAVKNAGKQATVKVLSVGDGQSGDCDLVEQGLFTKVLSQRADVQAITIVDAVLTLLQNKDVPGSKPLTFFTNNYWVSDVNDRRYCYEVGKK